MFHDSTFYKDFRHHLEAELNVSIRMVALGSPTFKSQQSVYGYTLRNPEREVDDRSNFMAYMKQRLAKKPWIADYSACTRTLFLRPFDSSYPTSRTQFSCSVSQTHAWPRVFGSTV